MYTCVCILRKCCFERKSLVMRTVEQSGLKMEKTLILCFANSKRATIPVVLHILFPGPLLPRPSFPFPFFFLHLFLFQRPAQSSFTFFIRFFGNIVLSIEWRTDHNF